MNHNDEPGNGPRYGADQLMTLDDVADYLQVPVKTLYDWRHKGVGPAGMRVGRYVRYRRADVDAWLETCRDPVLPLVGDGRLRAS